MNEIINSNSTKDIFTVDKTRSYQHIKLSFEKSSNMYVTRPLSMYKRAPSSLSLPPPEGPNSGILVILDEEAEPTCCFGMCKSHHLDGLPFPQNKNIQVRYYTGQTAIVYEVVFIPVLGQPLSSNRYYAIQPRGSHKGEAFKNSSDEDAVTCCFCRCFPDRKPQAADHHDMYQQFEIRKTNRGHGFVAKSVAPNGVPPGFLRTKGWFAYTSTPRSFTLGEAPGLDVALRTRLPEFDFPLSCKSSSPVVVGKWYCPFIFIKDGRLKDQVAKSMYYETTLEQIWERVFNCNSNDGNEDNVVVVDVPIEREVVRVSGSMVVSRSDWKTIDGVMWFGGDATARVGLSLAIVERMKWEEERFGWSGGDERLKNVEKMGTNGVWNQFGCYVLVERFVVRRMDGSVLLTYDFKHTHVVRNKWE